MNKTHIDWFAFRAQCGPVDVEKALVSAFPVDCELRERPRGAYNFDHAADLTLAGGLRAGVVCWGGDRQRGWLMASITGRGCEWIHDWDAAQERVTALPSYEAKRVDIALDTTTAFVSHESVVAAHAAGRFDPAGGGRPPKLQEITHADPADGRTAYIGVRKDSPKFVRAYEKGYELAKDFPRGTITHIDGLPVGELYRVELELKRVHSNLPEDVIDRRDQYFAGAYPYLGEILQVEPEIFAQRRERAPIMALDAALAQIRAQYGSTLYTAMVARGGDLSSVWQSIVGNKHNQALVDAGVLSVEHEA